ncbi:MAG TPA: tyrosine-type recombinase/integrase [Syntrophorhabdaceae bacterium]|nr:tyrosine-type recombinase/integrase [Syntrophorhabdaceae bacterium]
MTQTQASIHEPSESAVSGEHRAQTPVNHILERLSPLEFPAKDQLANYLRHKSRLNHKRRTLDSSFTSTRLFLDFYRELGKEDLKDLERGDLEAFIEHEQDRGLKISTVKTRMASLMAFLHFLVEQDLIPATATKKTIRFKLPDALPRAIAPKDLRKLLCAIHNTRDRALILLLLRTGIRIGEALGLTLNDIDLRDRKVHLFQGEKNSMGRVVYFSDDAFFALKRWLKRRDPGKQFLFYGQTDRPLCYSAAASRFKKYLTRAKLTDKGYTVHSLRHTYASELLNAGMRLECLQKLLGHQDIEMTGRYARLTDKTRKEEYFRAMAKIEKGEIDGDDR